MCRHDIICCKSGGFTLSGGGAHFKEVGKELVSFLYEVYSDASC